MRRRCVLCHVDGSVKTRLTIVRSDYPLLGCIGAAVRILCSPEPASRHSMNQGLRERARRCFSLPFDACVRCSIVRHRSSGPSACTTLECLAGRSRRSIASASRNSASADRLARRPDRSRSWRVAEAIRRFVAADEATSASEAPTGHPVVKIYETRVVRVCSHSNTERAKYLVVGATAMQLRGASRATRDIDILTDPSVASARRALRAMSKLGFVLAAEHLAEDVKPCVLSVNSGRQAPTD